MKPSLQKYLRQFRSQRLLIVVAVVFVIGLTLGGILSFASVSLWMVLLIAALVTVLLVASMAYLCAQNKSFCAFVLGGQDSEELRAVADRRFRVLVDVMASPLIFVRISDGVILYANRKATAMFEMEIASQQASLSVLDYYVIPEQRSQLLADVRAHGAVLDREILFKRPTGEIFWGLVSTVVGEWQGEPALVTSFMDITERKRFEDALHAVNANLNAELEQKKILQDQLRQLAVIDPLTSLNNRRHLEDVLPRELARAERENYPIALIMVDIDHFKRINDQHGHLAGDSVLRQFAAILRDEIRAGDVLCRYGGEEFLLLLPGVDLPTAANRAETWRERISLNPLQITPDVSIQVTASLGVASYPSHGADWDSLIKAADQSLYLAKNLGRNRVISAA